MPGVVVVSGLLVLIVRILGHLVRPDWFVCLDLAGHSIGVCLARFGTLAAVKSHKSDDNNDSCYDGANHNQSNPKGNLVFVFDVLEATHAVSPLISATATQASVAIVVALTFGPI